jgi:hypothetical protein
MDDDEYLTTNIATTRLDQMRLDQGSTTVLLSYIQDPSFDENSRTIAAIQLKNKIKSIYGVSYILDNQIFLTTACSNTHSLTTMRREKREKMQILKISIRSNLHPLECYSKA